MPLTLREKPSGARLFVVMVQLSFWTSAFGCLLTAHVLDQGLAKGWQDAMLQ